MFLKLISVATHCIPHITFLFVYSSHHISVYIGTFLFILCNSQITHNYIHYAVILILHLFLMLHINTHITITQFSGTHISLLWRPRLAPSYIMLPSLVTSPLLPSLVTRRRNNTCIMYYYTCYASFLILCIITHGTH